MADGPTDSRWPQLLSLSSHELRSPLSVVAGYIRMVLKERAGPISDQQRTLLQEAEKSCGRLSTVLAEMSDLSQLEAGTAPFNRSTVDVGAILADAIRALPELSGRTVTIDLVAAREVSLPGDAVRLRTALSAILHALQRELVTSDRLVVRVDSQDDGSEPGLRLTIGEPNRMDALLLLERSGLTTFDEWRGGSGLSLPNARRVIEAHGGRVWSPAENGKSSAIVILPRHRAGG
jgi:signal transduction histidine kinase